ncbi:glycosyltransferase [Actinomyces howellii]|uniref:Rhamnosyltransferase n=1 Tax=Actinomyces howellii TaxID=52771 RepID=A0A3S4RY63_9ACTO|nr:glycosyltransferase [Actinomyces howellii]VEG29908.1 rhamnosyltransferase [Actinomyces howellii]
MSTPPLDLPDRIDRVGAVVTAFAPGPGLVGAVEALAAQVEQVVVVDDGPERATEATRAVLADCRAHGAQVVVHDRNRGIAAALNEGAQHLDPACQAVLTVDQDSLLPPGYVAAQVEAYAAARAAGVPAGMVGPRAAGNIRRLPGTDGQDPVVVGGEPIQSGLLVTRALWRELGGFAEDLFIDGVDSDFYLRALDAGAVPVVAPVEIEHQLGTTVRAGLGPWRLPITVAAEFRYYYQVRNLVTLVRRHGRRHPRWCLRAVGKQARHLAIVTALAPGRRGRLARAARGLRDGLAGRGGAMKDTTTGGGRR